jgi:hypothetical protein
MPVGLPSVIDTAESDPDLELVLSFSLGGLTLSLYLIHLLPVAAVAASMLLASAG